MMAMRSEGSLYLMDNRIEQLSSIGLYVAMKQQSGSQWFFIIFCLAVDFGGQSGEGLTTRQTPSTTRQVLMLLLFSPRKPRFLMTTAIKPNRETSFFSNFQVKAGEQPNC